MQLAPLQILISESLRQDEVTVFPSSILVEAHDSGVRLPLYASQEVSAWALSGDYWYLLSMRYGNDSHYMSGVLKADCANSPLHQSAPQSLGAERMQVHAWHCSTLMQCTPLYPPPVRTRWSFPD